MASKYLTAQPNSLITGKASRGRPDPERHQPDERSHRPDGRPAAFTASSHFPETGRQVQQHETVVDLLPVERRQRRQSDDAAAGTSYYLVSPTLAVSHVPQSADLGQVEPLQSRRQGVRFFEDKENGFRHGGNFGKFSVLCPSAFFSSLRFFSDKSFRFSGDRCLSLFRCQSFNRCRKAENLFRLNFNF